MHKRLCFVLALASSPLSAQETVDSNTPVPDTAPTSMTEEQKLNDCLLRSAQTANAGARPGVGGDGSSPPMVTPDA